MWSLIGGGSSGLGLLAYNAIAARTLGIDRFGEFSFAIIIGTLIALLSMGGIDLASARRAARQGADQRTDDVAVWTMLSVALALATVVGLAVALGAPALAGVIGIEAGTVRWVALLGAAAGMRGVFERTISGLRLYHAQAAVRAIEAVTMVSGAAVLAAREAAGEQGFIAVFVAAVLLANACYAVAILRRRGTPAFSREEARATFDFARHAFVMTAVAYFLMYADKVLVRAEASDRELGLYVAYHAGSVMVAAQLANIMQNILLPAATRSADPRALARRVFRMATLGLVPALGLSMLGLAVILATYGPAFEFRLVTALVFAAWAIVYASNVLFASMTISAGPGAMRDEARFALVRSVLLTVCFVLLSALDMVSIEAVACTMLLVELCESLNLWRLVRHWLPDRPVEVGYVLGDAMGR